MLTHEQVCDRAAELARNLRDQVPSTFRKTDWAESPTLGRATVAVWLAEAHSVHVSLVGDIAYIVQDKYVRGERSSVVWAGVYDEAVIIAKVKEAFEN